MDSTQPPANPASPAGPAKPAEGHSKKRKHSGDSAKPSKPRENTAVYVTNLPLDATKDEICEVFRKYGIIAEELETGAPRIKMYEDDAGNFKGEALVVYFRPESVSLACQMLHETEFRFGGPGSAQMMNVQPADYSYKRQKDAPTETSKKDKQKRAEHAQRMMSKLNDWSDDEPEPTVPKPTRPGKVVILKHMFTLDELKDDPAAILDITEDIQEECSKLGEVTNVTLYDKEADGVVSVRFADGESAQECVKLMDGRWFGGTRVQAYIKTGREKFRQSGDRRDKDEMIAKYGVEGADETEASRMDRFGDWLEGEDKGSETEGAGVEDGEDN
ncbi:hypothetical protein N7468_002185 [Penicillium chermesinum]|uniref:RRM domain-containing protein n=1 Tax=Penicillium chermesinum TaxID=63820 RepID=A0A9W9PJF1_9EURO|nr:uncharacterized protein N7468_002185 [Penicillium chermesinum]KAJ5247202.1 hypothetical protein N7468_002185 [Penicillium chermesinum]KAJ6145446.1 hypothetical protein N7470_009341 [Penicillium chermesinum]